MHSILTTRCLFIVFETLPKTTLHFKLYRLVTAGYLKPIKLFSTPPPYTIHPPVYVAIGTFPVPMATRLPAVGGRGLMQEESTSVPSLSPRQPPIGSLPRCTVALPLMKVYCVTSSVVAVYSSRHVRQRS